jgi:hypothetical protein
MDGTWEEVDDREVVSDARTRFVEWFSSRQLEQERSDALLSWDDSDSPAPVKISL